MKTHKQLSWTVRFSLAVVATIAVVILYSKIGQTGQSTQQLASVKASPQDALIEWVVANGGTVRLPQADRLKQGVRGHLPCYSCLHVNSDNPPIKVY